ncbi:MAG: hypothetical protein RL754_893 [Bacteroidota bacterium]|jgi:hypothetical protein
MEMKNTMMGLALATTALLGGLSSCQPEEAQGLSTEDQDALIFMYEEEKLARDVYTTLSGIWSVNQLNMIQGSEQKHMDAIAALMVDYDIPYTTLDVGEFENADLKALYDDLVAQGSVTELAALTVGATIEDLDIVDLQEYVEATDEAVLMATYENLICGSKNHLRAFVMGIENKGGTYTPQFLTQDAYDAIIAGAHEECN